MKLRIICHVLPNMPCNGSLPQIWHLAKAVKFYVKLVVVDHGCNILRTTSAFPNKNCFAQTTFERLPLPGTSPRSSSNSPGVIGRMSLPVAQQDNIPSTIRLYCTTSTCLTICRVASQPTFTAAASYSSAHVP